MLVGKGKNVRSIAGDLGVDESTLSYRLESRTENGERNKQTPQLPCVQRSCEITSPKFRSQIPCVREFSDDAGQIDEPRTHNPSGRALPEIRLFQLATEEPVSKFDFVTAFCTCVTDNASKLLVIIVRIPSLHKLLAQASIEIGDIENAVEFPYRSDGLIFVDSQVLVAGIAAIRWLKVDSVTEIDLETDPAGNDTETVMHLTSEFKLIAIVNVILNQLGHFNFEVRVQRSCFLADSIKRNVLEQYMRKFTQGFPHGAIFRDGDRFSRQQQKYVRAVISKAAGVFDQLVYPDPGIHFSFNQNLERALDDCAVRYGTATSLLLAYFNANFDGFIGEVRQKL